MKATFPHMGNAHIPIKALLKGLNLEVIPPPPISERTIELGVKHSPEFACMPLKINMGNFIEALEKGADTIVMAGGWGPCRFGYYAQVERDILKCLNFDFNMIVLEAPDSRLSDLLKQLKSLGSNVSLWQAWKAIKFAWCKLNAVEKLERHFEYYLPRALNKDKVEQIYTEGLDCIDKADNLDEVYRITNYYLENLKREPAHQQTIIRIGLVGEIYTILEPAANYSTINFLGRLNAEVTRSIYLSEWINDHLLGGWIKKSNRKEVINCASTYLNYCVGGHGQETVGYSVDFARKKYDGVVQIGPLTCMPEIVAQAILGKVSEIEGIPCMTIYFDEHSGQAGLHTRLEAFVDMIQRRSQQQIPGVIKAPITAANPVL
ncbi:MAG: CoA protein activase [Syntrophomonadaceae bacterium]|jgi:predicted nucleotide-binding protein (sugar kinase/HSP70/actin superfamily)